MKGNVTKMLNPKVGDRVQVLRIPGIVTTELGNVLREPQTIERIVTEGSDKGVYVEGCHFALEEKDLLEWPYESFDQILERIELLPTTWKPAILKKLIETCGDAIVCPVQFAEQVVTEQTARLKAEGTKFIG